MGSPRGFDILKSRTTDPGGPMGFMDKAKQMAEQAQQKLDDAQKQFNQGQGSEGQQSSGGVRYDEHGRPIEGSPAGTAPPPAAEPADAGPAPGAATDPAQAEPNEGAPGHTPDEQDKPDTGDAD